jgi:hypothetical protein
MKESAVDELNFVADALPLPDDPLTRSERWEACQVNPARLNLPLPRKFRRQ